MVENDSISQMTSLVGQLIQNRSQQKSLREQLDILKGEEDELRRSILLAMGSAKSINLEGLGRITRTTKSYYSISNIEKLAIQMFKLMVENGQKGMPLSEGLLLQQRVSKSALDGIMDNLELDETQRAAYIAEAGLNEVSEPALSLTKK